MKRRAFLKAAVSSFALPSAALVSSEGAGGLCRGALETAGSCYDLRQPFHKKDSLLRRILRAILRVSWRIDF